MAEDLDDALDYILDEMKEGKKPSWEEVAKNVDMHQNNNSFYKSRTARKAWATINCCAIPTIETDKAGLDSTWRYKETKSRMTVKKNVIEIYKTGFASLISE